LRVGGRGFLLSCCTERINQTSSQLRPFAGLRQSEREAYECILEFLGQEQVVRKFSGFLRAVDTMSGVVHAQANGNMDDYFPQTVLAKKIETLILEESTEALVSTVRPQAMLCIAALRFPEPFPPPSPRGSAWGSGPTAIQALDDMLQALVLEGLEPSMVILQSFLEIILPCLVQSEKVHEQSRALGAISRLLRFICNFPELSHMAEFSMSGRLMGTLGLFCMNPNQEISMGASEALHYLFRILVLHRSNFSHTHTHGTSALDRGSHGLLCSFFGKYLTPKERADVMMVSMEAMTDTSRHDVRAASRMLRMILKFSVPDIGKVPEITEYIYHNMDNITEAVAQETIKKVLHLLAQTYTDEVILTLFKIDDQSQRGARKPWEILASFPKGYEVIMEHLLRRLTPQQKSRGQEPSGRTEISPLIAARALRELLLEPSRRTEVQALFPALFTALLFQIPLLKVEGATEAAREQHLVTQWMDPVSSTVEALKTLMRSTGYSDHVSYVQRLGGWELLTRPERYHEGVALLARAMIIKNCWHICPVFSLTVRILQEMDQENHLTALVFITELLQSPVVAAIVDEVTVRTLASWFQCEELASVKLLLRAVEILARHEHTVSRPGRGRDPRGPGGPECPVQLRALQPYVLNCCYSADGGIVAETLQVLRGLVEQLSWQHAAAFLTQLAFTLGPFLEEEAESLRLTAFEIYGALLAKVSRRLLVFPLRHQVLNLLVLLVLHLQDANVSRTVESCGCDTSFPSSAPVVPASLSLQIARPALCRTATLMGWSKLKAIFAEKDVWTILRALLKWEEGKALWFLKQSVMLFKSPQAPIRQAAVWFAGQVIQTLSEEEAREVEETHAALKHMQEDPDPAVSCLAAQTSYVLEAKEKMKVTTPSSCFCCRKPRKARF
uniref:Maestro heat-like repeat family member 5 n=1 Tax=Balaenoptera musculus TaxID=9771 RepID=A0A8C0CD63_BALMU